MVPCALEEREGSSTGPGSTGAAPEPGLSGAQLRAAQKEMAALERRLERLEGSIDAARTGLADHDQSDYVGLGEEMAKITAMEAERDDIEQKWFALTEQVG